MPSQFDRVQVGRGADPKYPDQFVLAAIEAALAGVGLHPSDQIEHRPVDAAARGNQFLDMAPIHTHKVNGPIDRDLGRGTKRLFQKGDEPSRDISPDAMANSRCFAAPRPTTLPIATL